MSLERATTTQRLELVVGTRLGRALERDMAVATTLVPSHTAARFAAALLALCVLVVLGTAFVGGVALVVLGAPRPFPVLAGVALVAAAVAMRPRLGSSAVRSTPPAVEVPVLHDLIADVATELGVAFPDAVVLDAQFDASLDVRGLRRRRVLRLGVPLLSALDGQGKVALVAHELARERNDDARRTLLVGVALNSLAVGATLPDRRAASEPSVLAPFVEICLWLVSRPAHALWWIESRLLWRDSQRARYVADDLAASVAGTAGVIAVHDAALATPAMRTAVQRMAVVAGGEPTELFAQLRAACAPAAEERERLRLRARLDDPPTASRIAVLERRAPRRARVVVDAVRARRIASELARLQLACAHELLDARRAWV
ncbi:MAG TPA: hypothetical protein VFZ89_13905 [Solirubrobacteraceae bacterium]